MPASLVRIYCKEHDMTPAIPSELDNWDSSTPVWTPFRGVSQA
ncbi:hypothetical protein [Burkholderia sp. WAC0059]|nr:hypothetical protein [Burkholderia sp. WAC0059]